MWLEAMSSKYGIEIFGNLQSVPRLEWTDPSALETMKKQLPVVLTKTNLAGKALQKWADLDYMAKHISATSKFHVYFCKGHFLYCNRKDQAKTPYVFESKVREESLPFVKFKELLEEKTLLCGKDRDIQSNDKGGKDREVHDELVYLQQPLYAGIGAEITNDFSSINWGWVNSMKTHLNFGELTTNTLLIGQEGSVTPLHYDEQDNFLHQIGGAKTCILFSPANFPHFHPFPVHHPCDRQSQFDFKANNNNDCSIFEKLGENIGQRGWKCVLEKGDVLYIPKYWWHHIINSKNTSTAINFWFRAPDLGQKIFEHIPLVKPVMKVNLCRNVEKLAVTELKGVRKAALFFKHWDDYFARIEQNAIDDKPPRADVKDFDEYFKTVVSRLKLVLREEDIEGFLRDYLFNGRFSRSSFGLFMKEHV